MMTAHFVRLTVAALCLGGALPAHAQTAAASSTRAHVELLASDKLAGREAGSEGERLAAEYLAAQLAKMGARPLPGRPDMLQTFEFTSGSRDGGSEIILEAAAGVKDARGVRWDGAIFPENSIRALSFSDDATVTGEMVFAGYGIVVPEAQNFGYDSYVGLDVKDKIVVVLRYFPEDADQKTKAILARYSDLRYKAMAARQRGAKAMLVVTGPRSPNAGQLVPMTSDTAIAGSGIPAASVDSRVAEQLFAGQKPLREIQQELDSGNPHVSGFPLTGLTATVMTKVVRERRMGRNVVAYLPATSPVGAVQKPWIVIGAHYDHLGRGTGGNSLASGNDVGRPHVGADDNASGSAAVLAIVDALAKQPARRRHLLVGLWSAEEIGLIGSNAFVTQHGAADPSASAASPRTQSTGTQARSAPAIEEIAAYLNFDMVGRMQDNRLAVQATGTSPVWASILERANVAAGFDLAVQPDPYQPTDVATFNQASVPSLSFTTGAHTDYHKPSDTADKINYADLDRIAAFAAAITRRLMELDDAPQFTKVEQSSQTANRTGIRVFTGTVPDYAAEVKGLLLSGVIGGGPAEKAGLQKGDVIVEIAGQSITNIYDYTFALELLKIDQPVKVVYMRGNEKRETEMTPTARR